MGWKVNKKTFYKLSRRHKSSIHFIFNYVFYSTHVIELHETMEAGRRSRVIANFPQFHSTASFPSQYHDKSYRFKSVRWR